MIDRDGYRPNVGIILCNGKNEVFWGKRVREHSWQFPQGGIKPGETPELAMYRVEDITYSLTRERVDVATELGYHFTISTDDYHQLVLE